MSYNFILISIVVLALVSSCFGKMISNKVFIGLSKRVHRAVANRVLTAKIVFFEENTQGRIINRFSKDVGTLDNFVFTFLEMTDYIIKCTYSLGIVLYLCPWLILLVGVSLVYLVRLRRKCLHTTRDPIRLKYSLMSPVNSLIQDAVNGLVTIRCLH